MNIWGSTVVAAAALAAVFGFAGTALADIEFDQDITPDIIFGAGNTNGDFTTDRQDGVEIGIRAKIPFVGPINSNGDGTYSFSLEETDHDGNPETFRRWNFDWTVNTDFDEIFGARLDEFTYELGLDSDPGTGTNFLKFDPITPTEAIPFF